MPSRPSVAGSGTADTSANPSMALVAPSIEKVTDENFRVTEEMLKGEGIVVRKGKKTYHRFVLKD